MQAAQGDQEEKTPTLGEKPEGDDGAEGKGETGGAAPSNAEDHASYKAAIAERDKEIAALETQIAEAAKTAAATEDLYKQIADLKAQVESERLDYELKLARCKSTRIVCNAKEAKPKTTIY